MLELFFDFCGLVPGLLIIACQFAAGQWISQKYQLQLSVVSQWAIGLSFFCLLNVLFLTCQVGYLIHFNFLALIFLSKKNIFDNYLVIKKFLFSISCIFLLLLVANTFNPVISWDAQANWIGLAAKWANNNSLALEYWHHIYDKRPQMVSVVYAWALKWGNETTCQFLDLMFFIAFFSWLGDQLKMNNKKILLAFLMAISGLSLFSKAPSTFCNYIGTGDGEFILCFLLVALIELSTKLPKAKLLWILLGIVFINCRMNALAIYSLLAFFVFIFHQNKKTLLFPLTLVFLLGSPWYLWNYISYGDPFYPHAIALFDSFAANDLILSDFSKEGFDVRQVTGVRNLSDLYNYIQHAGIAMLVFPLSLLLRLPKNCKLIFLLAWCSGLVSMFITSQPRFQFFSLLVLACLIVSHATYTKVTNQLKIMGMILMIFASFSSLQNISYKAFRLIADSRHGKEYLMENRIRLYPALKWMNQQKLSEATLWPYNPLYYCQFPVIREDVAAYQLPNSILNDSQKIREYLSSLGIVWIVRAKPFYPPLEKAVISMEKHIDWITKNDAHCIKVKTIKNQGVSPQTEIFKLLKK